MSMINELASHGSFTGTYRITSCRQLLTSSGKEYLRMYLTDASGDILAYAWSGQYEGPWHIENMGSIKVTGATRIFNGKLIADIQTAIVIDIVGKETIRLLPTRFCSAPSMLPKFVAITDAIKCQILSNFINSIFSDMSIAIPFMNVPGSLKHHHSEPGGLLRHSIECAEITASLSMLQPTHRDLAITAALLHDLGKISSFDSMRRTDLGYLVDHQALTLELCANQLKELDRIRPDYALALRHLLTCRTIKRWGYEPRMAIAHAVQLADKLSVEMDMEYRSFSVVDTSRNVSGRIVNGPTYWRPIENSQNAL